MERLSAVRNRKQALRVVKELDAFPKVPDGYKETTASGGGLAIITFVGIFVLVISEIRFYSNTSLKYDYEVDGDFNKKMKINIDMVVAMRCDLIGADVLDVTGQDARNFGRLMEENTYFELSPRQRMFFESKRDVNRYLREEYHAIHELLWLQGSLKLAGDLPPREDKPTRDFDACRLYGSFDVNKVAGNFHVTAGKSIPHPRGHAHFAALVDKEEYNFSHRINHFSFGEPLAAVVSPLDGEELITSNNYHMFQYFIKVVPTEVRTYAANVDTYQFSVSERNRSINHSEGSHGVAGIFMKYDLNSLKIRVREERKPYWMFLVRMCGIIGGIFAVSRMLHGFMSLLIDVVCCRFKMGKYKPQDEKTGHTNSSVPGTGGIANIQQQQHLPDLPNISNIRPDIQSQNPVTTSPLLQQQFSLESQPSPVPTLTSSDIHVPDQ